MAGSKLVGPGVYTPLQSPDQIGGASTIENSPGLKEVRMDVNVSTISKKTDGQGTHGVTLDQKVFPKHRINLEQFKDYYDELHMLNKRIEEMDEKEPLKSMIIEITDKISAWKQGMGNLEQQEDRVHEALKTKDRISIHNYNTLYAKLKEI